VEEPRFVLQAEQTFTTSGNKSLTQVSAQIHTAVLRREGSFLAVKFPARQGSVYYTSLRGGMADQAEV